MAARVLFDDNSIRSSSYAFLDAFPPFSSLDPFSSSSTLLTVYLQLLLETSPDTFSHPDHVRLRPNRDQPAIRRQRPG